MDRRNLLGPPHSYLIHVQATCGIGIFEQPADLQCWLQLWEQLRQVFDLNLYAWSVTASEAILVLRHRSEFAVSDEVLRTRWQLLRSDSSQPPPPSFVLD